MADDASPDEFGRRGPAHPADPQAGNDSQAGNDPGAGNDPQDVPDPAGPGPGEPDDLTRTRVLPPEPDPAADQAPTEVLPTSVGDHAPAAGDDDPASRFALPDPDPDSTYLPIFAQPTGTGTDTDLTGAGLTGAGPTGAAASGAENEAWGPPTSAPVLASTGATAPGSAGTTSAPPRRRLWPIVLVCALVSALIGGLAGFGGSLLPGALTPLPSSSLHLPSPSASSASPSSSLPPAPRQADVATIAQKVLPSVVLITARRGSTGALGSGFVIDADNGYVLTNSHVVELGDGGGDLVVTLDDGTQSQARIVGRSPTYDVAVIQLQERDGLVEVELGDSDAARVGDPVVALGAPLGLQRTVTAGVLSAKHRAIAIGLSRDGSNASSLDVTWIDALQTDASINPGNSGGPLVDAAGRVIGIDSAAETLGGTPDNPTGSIGLGFAIPINQASALADELIRDGEVAFPTTGLGLTDDDQFRLGVRVSSVADGGAAEEAGLAEGDVITMVGDRETYEPVQLIVQTRTYRPGDEVVFTFVRDGQTDQVTLTLGGKVG